MTRNLTFAPRGYCGPSGHKHMAYIDIAYLIGIVLVVWGHSHPLDSSWWGTWYSDLNGFIYTFHMPLFFFIGGYLLVHSHSIDQLGYRKWAKEKILKFLIPYFVLTLLAYLPKAMLGDTSDAVELSLGYFLKTTFLIPRIGVWGHFWFIPAFLALDLIWGIWRRKSPQNPRIYRIGLLFGCIVSLLLAAFPIQTDWFVLHDLSQEAIFYACGILLGLMKPVLWNKLWKNIAGCVIGIFCAYILYPYGNYTNTARPIINFIVGLTLVWVCWSAAQLFAGLKFIFPAKFTKYNFSIFIYSWPAQALLDTILRRLGVNWLIIIAILFVAGFIIPLCIVMTYKKLYIFHCKFFDYLIGIKTDTRRRDRVAS